MSLAALLNEALSTREHQPYDYETELQGAQAALATQPNVGGYGEFQDLFHEPTYKLVDKLQNLDAPGRETNPTNDPSHAMRLVWANLPPLVESTRIWGNQDNQLQTLFTADFSGNPPDMRLTQLDPALVRKIPSMPPPPKHVPLPRT